MKPETLSLYVHWPFCEAKCPYCDFNSHVREKIDAGAYEKALLTELDHLSAQADAKNLTSIFFGGGTPSLMPPETAGAVIAKAKETWKAADDIEITLEANPGSSEAKKFEAFERAGVNRLSLGVQSLHDDALKFLGRIHNAGEALTAIQMAKDTFPRFSFDLIYARPGQTLEEWRDELGRALDLSKGHLSLYQLTLEKDTAFYRAAKRGKLILPDDDISADLFTMTREMCRDAGLSAYEISNYAALGDESRHNLNYWQGGQYLGIGPGAHSRLYNNNAWTGFSTIKGPEKWLSSVDENGHGVEERLALSPKERLEELVMMGFRLNQGVPKKEAFPAIDHEAFNDLKTQGLVFETNTHIGATEPGTLVLNHILGEILT